MAAPILQPLKGFRDLLPSEKKKTGLCGDKNQRSIRTVRL